MSLRKKLILLFMGLAVLPLLVLAAFSYWYAQSILRGTVQGQLHETALAIGEDFKSRATVVEWELASITEGLNRQPEEDRGRLVAEAQAREGAFLAQAEFIQVKDDAGEITTLSGVRPTDSVHCSEAGGSRLLVFSTGGPEVGSVNRISAGFWASELLGSFSGLGSQSSHLVDLENGTTVFSQECSALQAGGGAAWGRVVLDPQDPTGLPSTFSYREAGKGSLGAFVPVSDSNWGVVSTAPPYPVVTSINRMVLAYWLFVLVLSFSTAIAFSMLLGKFTKSLQELARAAEEIGTGELDPWLPLPTSGEVGQLTLAFSRMLTRIRQMMAKVDQSGRLAVVGQLSAYLAHEIRNPLSSIKLNLQRLQRWGRNGSIPEFCVEPVEISLKEVDRLSAAVSGVLELSSAPNSPLEPVGLHSLVGEAADLLSARFRRQRVSLTLDLDAEADRVLGRVGQIKGVILNLMVNALEAQPDGGSLEIRSELTQEPEIGGPVVALHFKDNGWGVPAEVRDRVFEPFFSTKTGGSGIGLAMASQAVQDCLGDLYLEPSVSTEAGAEFVVLLPLAAMEAGTAPELRRDLEPWTGVPPHWRRRVGVGGGGAKTGVGMPPHLMAPNALNAILPLSDEESEEVN